MFVMYAFRVKANARAYLYCLSLNLMVYASVYGLKYVLCMPVQYESVCAVYLCVYLHIRAFIYISIIYLSVTCTYVWMYVLLDGFTFLQINFDCDPFIIITIFCTPLECKAPLNIYDVDFPRYRNSLQWLNMWWLNGLTGVARYLGTMTT